MSSIQKYSKDLQRVFSKNFIIYMKCYFNFLINKITREFLLIVQESILNITKIDKRLSRNSIAFFFQQQKSSKFLNKVNMNYKKI